MHITTRRDTSTTGTITAMSMVDLVFFLFEQYVSLTFEHTGLPSNLVTQMNNISINHLSNILATTALLNYDCNIPPFSSMTNPLIVLIRTSNL